MTFVGYPHNPLRSAQPVCIILCMDGVPEWTKGDRLRKAREYANLSIQDMADQLGYHRNTITAYEADDRAVRPGTVRAWADICKVDLHWLDSGAIVVCDEAMSDSLWGSFYGSQDPLPFDEVELADVIDLRDRAVTNLDDFLPSRDSFALSAKAN